LRIASKVRKRNMTGRQEKEDDGTSKEQLKFELRTYHDALNSIR
jgi:hypothetical protein